MRYGGVDTASKNSVTRGTPVDYDASESETENINTANTRNKSRRTMMQRIRSTWRSNRKKNKNKNKKGSNSSTSTSTASSKSKLLTIRKADSNATEVRSNTTKSAIAKVAEGESREQEEEKAEPLPSIREGFGTLNTDVTDLSDIDPLLAGVTSETVTSDVKLFSPANDFSIEVDGEDENVVLIPGRPTAFTRKAACADTQSFSRSPDKDEISKFDDDKSLAVIPSGQLTTQPEVVKCAQEIEVEDVDETASVDNNQLSLLSPAEKGKWVKKVCLSIGGYKTSFQFSDPMTNLAQTVNDALNVVDDGALVQDAKALDDMNDEEKVEEERDYDENPTKLFMYLQQRAWGMASAQLKNNPEEAKIWVYRRQIPKTTLKVADEFGYEALTTQSQALVVHEAVSADKLRWKLLPLHACIVLGAPPEMIMDIIRIYPNATRKTDERGSLPVHLASSRLDVDPDGEKVLLHLIASHPESIHIQDRKGRTPPDLAKLARMRKDAEELRRTNSLQDVPGIEKTASSFTNDAVDNNEDDDDNSVKTSMSARFKMMLKKSKSTDTVDRRKKKKKGKKVLTANTPDLLKSRSADLNDDVEPDEIGPGFAILKPPRTNERHTSDSVNPQASFTDEGRDEDVSVFTEAFIPTDYTTPVHAPRSTDEARSVPLPKSFCDDDASLKSNRTRSMSPKLIKPDIKFAALEEEPRLVAVEEESKLAAVEGELRLNTKEAENNVMEQQHNEALVVLLQKAAENAGHPGEDMTVYLKDLEDEWVTDVEALRRIDGETLDVILPIILSREVQRLMNHADTIDDRFLTENNQKAKWVLDDSKACNVEMGTKTTKRTSRKSKKLERRNHAGFAKEVPLNAIAEERDDNVSFADDSQTVYSIATEAPAVNSRENSTVRITEAPTGVMEFKDKPTVFDNELEVRKLHADLIADARKKFPTRESLEDAIRVRQQEVEAAVESGFDVDKQTLSRAALADDEVRKLLPLRLILPSFQDLNEMVGVLQVHKENALRNTNMKKASRLQTEIDELQTQIDLEKHYILKRKLLMTGSKCITCGDAFVPQTKMVGILRTKEHKCSKCRVPPSVSSVEKKTESFDGCDTGANVTGLPHEMRRIRSSEPSKH